MQIPLISQDGRDLQNGPVRQFRQYECPFSETVGFVRHNSECTMVLTVLRTR